MTAATPDVFVTNQHDLVLPPSPWHHNMMTSSVAATPDTAFAGMGTAAAQSPWQRQPASALSALLQCEQVRHGLFSAHAPKL
jgi:hypothetical protein